MLRELFEQIWEEDVPEQCEDGHLIKLPRKDNLEECKNHRGIMLLSVPGKVLNRLTTTLDAELIETCMQAGFRKDRSCTDQIVTFHITVEETLEWNSLLYVNFVDFQKAFDSLDRNSLWTLMRHYGIPEKLITIIQKLYRPLTCQKFHNGSLSQNLYQ